MSERNDTIVKYDETIYVQATALALAVMKINIFLKE